MHIISVTSQAQKGARLVLRGRFGTFAPKYGPKTPIDVFRETFKREWERSKELQDSIKTLEDASGRLGESEAYKRAREAYVRAQRGSTIVGKTLRKTGETVEDFALRAWESEVARGTRKAATATAKKLDETLEPVRKTQIYKDVADAIEDDDATRYGGFLTKEQRREKRERDLATGRRTRAIGGDQDAGKALIATEIESRESLGQKIEDFKQRTWLGRLIQSAKQKLWDDTDNPLIVFIRKITGKIGGFFAETEAAKVYAQFKAMDANFTAHAFTRYMRDYIVPEVLEAYVRGDEPVLRKWLSEAPFNVYAAQNKMFRQQGLVSDSRILDIRGVEIVSAKMLQPQDIPVLVVGCRAQEISLYRKVKTGEVAAGDESNILMSSYAMVLTRDPEMIEDEETEGWKVIEFVRGASRQFT